MGASAVGCCQHPGTRVLTGREERRGGSRARRGAAPRRGAPRQGGPSPGAPAGSAACEPRIPDFSLRGRRRARPAAPAAVVLSLVGQPRGAGAPSRTPVPVPRGCADSWGASVDGEGAAPSSGVGGGGAHGPVASFCAFPAGPALTGGQCRPGREETGSGRAGRPGEEERGACPPRGSGSVWGPGEVA